MINRPILLGRSRFKSEKLIIPPKESPPLSLYLTIIKNIK